MIFSNKKDMPNSLQDFEKFCKGNKDSEVEEEEQEEETSKADNSRIEMLMNKLHINLCPICLNSFQTMHYSIFRYSIAEISFEELVALLIYYKTYFTLKKCKNIDLKELIHENELYHVMYGNKKLCIIRPTTVFKQIATDLQTCNNKRKKDDIDTSYI